MQTHHVEKDSWRVEVADAPRPRCGTAGADRRAALQIPHLPLLLPYQSVPDPSHFGMDPDPRLWLTDPDPASFANDIQNANKFFCLLLVKGTFTIYIIFQR